MPKERTALDVLTTALSAAFVEVEGVSVIAGTVVLNVLSPPGTDAGGFDAVKEALLYRRLRKRGAPSLLTHVMTRRGLL